MLDIYFATRFLQLKEGLPDRNGERSTASTIRTRDSEAISMSQYEILADGYNFLSSLDHHLRITVGRATRLPIANKAALEIMTDRMGLASTEELLGLLAVTRGSVRAVFDEITGT